MIFPAEWRCALRWLVGAIRGDLARVWGQIRRRHDQIIDQMHEALTGPRCQRAFAVFTAIVIVAMLARLSPLVPRIMQAERTAAGESSPVAQVVR